MASLVDEELQPALATLSRLSEERPYWMADLGVSRNIMQDMFGGPVLSDPVYRLRQSRGRPAKETALGIQVPVRLRGARALVRPAVVSFGGSAELRQEKLEQLSSLGLRPIKTFPVFGKDHLSFVESGPQWVEASAFGPGLRKNLLNDCYSHFLSKNSN
jgi:hypothetical protein